MTEVLYILAGFEEKFSAFKGKKILLHGSRNYARALIESYDSVFHFLGVVSFEAIESDTFCGVSVFQQDSIPELRPDLIILTERVKYAEEAYCALRRICKKNGISLWNMYGLDEFQLHREAEMTAPQNAEEWKKVCFPYDRVVFEVMDTLIRFPLTGEKPAVKESFRELIPWLREQGKRVGFSLRKSFSDEKQVWMLRNFALVKDENEELIHRQGEDLSFRMIRETYPEEKILYIGKGLVNEFILPRCYGIDSRRVGECWDSCLVPETEEPVHIPFSGNRRERIETEIRKHTYISFDVFDTLLIRKTLYPSDVFSLTWRRAGKAGVADCDSAAGRKTGKSEISDSDFASARRQAELECAYADIYTIYEYLEDRFDWSAEKARQIMEIELGVERDVLSPRKEVVELLRYARQQGKKIFLTSDMYLPGAFFRSLLAENGITEYDRLLVSCDCKKAKQTGLFEELIALCGGKSELILHLGDNPAADGIACEKANIHSILIPSVLDLARERGWEAAVHSSKSLQERCLIGMTIAEMFRDPFQNPNLHERSLEKRLWRYGTGAVGPLVSGFITWLIENLRENDFDGVLFLARDGYLPIQIYKKLQKKTQLPKALYFYANRHAAFLCGSDSEERITYILDEGRQKGLSARDILKNIYRIPEKFLLPKEKEETVVDYIDRHMPLIHKIAEASREGYRRYSEQCGMHPGKRYAVVDFVAAGTAQMYLQSFLPYPMKGFYFGSYNLENKGKCDVDYYLHGSNPAFLNSFIEMEGYFTSPEPAQDCMGKDGTAVFFKETRTQQELQEFRMVYDAAMQIAEDFFRLFYQDGETISPAVVEEMYGAEGYHWVQQHAFDDWLQVPIRTRGDNA